ncbi:MAG: Fic family protein [Anaerolineae bacterium]
MDLQAFRDSETGKVLRVPGQDYWAYYPAPLPPRLAWTSDLVLALSSADSALGELKGLGHKLANPHLLIAPFIRREAVLSSRIEGTQASLTDLYAYEAAQLPLFDRPADVKEVYNYVGALEYGLARLQTFPLSLRLIRELHAHLMEGVRGEYQTPGEFRRSQNWIGPPGYLLNDATFVPPPPDAMHAALNDLETYLHAPPVLPPLVRLGLIHYQFETIHPFLDGNGRVGRLLIVLLLCAWGLLPRPLLYLSAYFQRHREAYYEHLLAVSQRGAWDAWLRFFLRGICEQSQDAIARSRRLLDLRERYREQFQNQRAAARLLQVIDYLFARPIITVNSLAQAEEDIDYQSAYRYVNTLEGAGILREITGQARNRVYQADAILEAIAAPLPNQGGETA